MVRERLYRASTGCWPTSLGEPRSSRSSTCELLSYDLELNTLRTRAVNEKYILLLLPGQHAGDRVTLFHEASPEWHETLPKELLPEDHLFELMLRALKRFQRGERQGPTPILDCSR